MTQALTREGHRSSENLFPRTVELFHDLAQFAEGQALLEIFNPMEGPVGKSDFAGKSPHRLVAPCLAQVFGQEPVVQVHASKAGGKHVTDA